MSDILKKLTEEFTVKTAIFIVGFFLVIQTVISVVAFLIIKIALGTVPFEYVSFVLSITTVAADLVLIILLGKWFDLNLKQQVRKIQLNQTLLFILLAFFVFMWILPLVQPIDFVKKLFNAKLIFHRLNSELLSTFKLGIIFNFITVVIIIPVVEEIIFRGIIFSQLLKKYSAGVSLLISSLLFAFMHLKFMGFAYLVLYGLLFGYSYYRTKSLLVPILLHAFINLMANLTSTQIIPLNSGNWAVWFLVFIGSMGAAFLLFSFLNRGEENLKINVSEQKHKLKNLFSCSENGNL